jgi:hypothetical protein
MMCDFTIPSFDAIARVIFDAIARVMIQCKSFSGVIRCQFPNLFSFGAPCFLVTVTPIQDANYATLVYNMNLKLMQYIANAVDYNIDSTKTDAAKSYAKTYGYWGPWVATDDVLTEM